MSWKLNGMIFSIPHQRLEGYHPNKKENNFLEAELGISVPAWNRREAHSLADTRSDTTLGKHGRKERAALPAVCKTREQMELWVRYMIKELKGYQWILTRPEEKLGWKELKTKKVFWRVPDPEAANITTSDSKTSKWLKIMQEWTSPQP